MCDGSVIQFMNADEPFAGEQLPGTCRKCGLEGLVAKLPFRESECKECFLAYVRHKFRTILVSSKVLPKGSKVLVFFDGSAEALVLLDMIHFAQNQNNFKSLHCAIQVIHIDERDPAEDHTKHAAKVNRIACTLKKFNSFKNFITPFSVDNAALVHLYDVDDYLTHGIRNSECKFQAPVEDIHSLTSKLDYIKQKRRRLLASACVQLNCDFLFLPDISLHLATQLITDIALGRGGSAALGTFLVDDRFHGIKIVRPLKNFNNVEVRYYLQVQNLIPANIRSFDSSCETPCLQNVTRLFIERLQLNFSSTVATILKTGGKILPNNEVTQQNFHILNKENEGVELHMCVFCNSRLDVLDYSTIHATDFSRMVSEMGATLRSCPTIGSLLKINSCNEKEELRRQLCHGCRNIVDECTNMNSKM